MEVFFTFTSSKLNYLITLMASALVAAFQNFTANHPLQFSTQ
jgi:hypothetical protein